MTQRSGSIFLVSGLLMLLFASMIFTTPSGASVVWSDDFNDGNLDGWTVSGSSHWGESGERTLMVLAKGNFSLADKTLRAPGQVKGGYTDVSHPTKVTTGTWSFDFYSTPGAALPVLTDFIDKPIITTPLDWNGYAIDFMFEMVYLYRIDNGWYTILASPRFELPDSTWTHVDMTRDSGGRWCVYINSTLILDKVDTAYSNFSYFDFLCHSNTRYDNMAVSDTIYFPPGSMRITVKDSSGNALSGVSVSSSKQPSGQAALSGTTTADGTVTFIGLTVGNYTFQVSKSGYVSGSAQGAVASGAKTELSSTLQVQPSSGISGFPIASVLVGILLCTVWYWIYPRRMRLRGV